MHLFINFFIFSNKAMLKSSNENYFVTFFLNYRLYNFYKYIQPYPDSYSYTNKLVLNFAALYLVMLRWNTCDKVIFVLSFLGAALHLFVLVGLLLFLCCVWWECFEGFLHLDTAGAPTYNNWTAHVSTCWCCISRETSWRKPCCPH